MTPLHVVCPRCSGAGYLAPDARSPWPLCTLCDATGAVFEPGAPGYGCTVRLGDRVPGEIVTLGNGDHGRVLRHSRAGTPSTWLGPIGLFDRIESHRPVTYPSCAGVSEVHESRMRGDANSHATSRTADPGDPLQRQIQYGIHTGR